MGLYVVVAALGIHKIDGLRPRKKKLPRTDAGQDENQANKGNSPNLKIEPLNFSVS